MSEDERDEVLEVNYNKLPKVASIEKIDEFAKEVDQVSFKQLKSKITLDQAESRQSVRSRRSQYSMSRQASQQAEREYSERSARKAKEIISNTMQTLEG